MSEVNIFKHYSQEENRFTNGLFSILNLARAERQEFVSDFFSNLVAIRPSSPLSRFRVLEGVAGTVDADVRSEDTVVLFETKVKSVTLRADQIERHLLKLREQPEAHKHLVLLTPDDTMSNYISKWREQSPEAIVHLAWKDVLEYLERFAQLLQQNTLSMLIQQFVEMIRDTILRQDISGIIATISFGDHSGIYPRIYLDELRQGRRRCWRTPKEYKQLSGTRRKLLLYDPMLKAITAVVEISAVRQTNEHPNFPWSNDFAEGTFLVLSRPIPRDLIRSISGLENFGKGRSPFRTITHEQLAQLRSEAHG